MPMGVVGMCVWRWALLVQNLEWECRVQTEALAFAIAETQIERHECISSNSRLGLLI